MCQVCNDDIIKCYVNVCIDVEWKPISMHPVVVLNFYLTFGKIS